MKSIQYNSGIVIISFLHNPPRISEVVNALEKADVLERRSDAFLAANLEQVAVAFGQVILSLQFQRRGGDDKWRSQSRAEGEAALGFVFHQLIFPAVLIAPLPNGDDAGHDQPVICQRAFHLTHFAAAPDVFVNIVDPQLNAVVARLGGQLDFAQQGLRLDGAGV